METPDRIVDLFDTGKSRNVVKSTALHSAIESHIDVVCLLIHLSSIKLQPSVNIII